MIEKDAFVHPSAEIAESAVIESGAYVGKNCIIHDNVRVGFRAVVERDTEIGAGTVLSPNAHVGGAPQDISYKGEDTKLKIGRNCVIREFATLNRASTKEDWLTEIGDDCFLMAYTHIGHDCKVGNGLIMANCTALAGHVIVGNNVNMSGQIGIHQFVRIGDMCMLGMQVGISKDVPPFCLVGGSPAKIAGLNSVGLKRRGVSPEARRELKKAMHLYLNKSISLKELPDKLSELEGYDEIIKLREFLSDTKRSFMRG